MTASIFGMENLTLISSSIMRFKTSAFSFGGAAVGGAEKLEILDRLAMMEVERQVERVR